MLMHNDRGTGLDYMEETLTYLALQGWYNIASAVVFNQLSATDQWQCTCRAHLLRSKQFRTSPLSALYHSRYSV